MPRRFGVLLIATLALSLGGNVVLALRITALRHGMQRRVVVCHDSENMAYSPGAMLVIDGQLMRCKVSGVWVGTDEWGKPLGQVSEAPPTVGGSE